MEGINFLFVSFVYHTMSHAAYLTQAQAGLLTLPAAGVPAGEAMPAGLPGGAGPDPRGAPAHAQRSPRSC
jgi:hypothetical protein